MLDIHCPPFVDLNVYDTFCPEAQYPSCPFNGVMGVRMGHEHGCLFISESLSPNIGTGDIARRQQGGQIGQGGSGSDDTSEGVWFPAYLLTDGLRDRMFDGGRPGAHFIDGHHLVSHGTDRIEQACKRNRRRYLVPHIMRVVKMVTSIQSNLNNLCKTVNQT